MAALRLPQSVTESVHMKRRLSVGFVVALVAATAIGLGAPNCLAQSSLPTRSSKSKTGKGAAANSKRNGTKDRTRDPKDSSMNSMDYDTSIGPHLLNDFAEDQKETWTSPLHVRLADADWLVPLGVATGGLLATDTEFSKHLSDSPNRLRISNDFSNYGVGSLVAVGGGLYLLGKITHNDHKSETGLLAGEAAINSLAVAYAAKYAFGRERPRQDNYRGGFWQGGASFPSEHSAAAWSIASVIAHEYPGRFTSVLAYGLATAVSASRITAKQHFPSDALVGGAIGWLVAEEVYRHHHDPELDGSGWPTYAESRDRERGLSSTSIGTPYVELDSWIYPAIERLAALGYIHSEYLGVRPWTRLECAQLVEEAGDEMRARDSGSGEAEELYGALSDEFRPDLDRLNGENEPSVQVESLYSTTTQISGKPLNDSEHFGQTIINDFGRPYQEGFNSYDGFSAYGTAGRFTLYVRGEYQHAPWAPAYPLAARQVIANTDFNGLPPATPFASVDQFRLLDTYVAANVGHWNFSFGKQSLWWGPDDGGSLMFSDNAEPIYMFRAVPIGSFTVPLLSRLLGPFKTDFFFGKLSGNEYPPRPLIHGEKVSFKPSQNLEFSFSRTVEFAGVGRATTLGAIWNSYASVKSSVNYRASVNPGKRSSSVDGSYRIPYLRNWLTVYGESFSPDDVTTLANPPRAAWSSGIYMPRLPGLAKLDLRVEGGYTDVASFESLNGNFVYYDYHYHNLYTNKANILGSWMGREGKGIQAWTTYWFNARSSLEFGYRHAKVAKDFIPQGETINDASAELKWQLGKEWTVSSSLQYEKWFAPVLAPTPQTNWTSTVQVEFWPRKWKFPR
jgi:hypothetical protein